LVVTRMTDLRIGRLTMVDGCLRMGQGEVSHVVVWPPDFEVSREGDRMWVYFDDFEKELRLGQVVALMGGEVESIAGFDEDTRQRVPLGCKGPYWLVGSVSPAGKGEWAEVSGDLAGSVWLLVSMRGERLIKGTEITLHLGEESLEGSMTCNGYTSGSSSGGYRASQDGVLIVFEPIALSTHRCTRMPGVMEQEAAYIEALRSAEAYQLIFDTLQIAGSSGEVTLVFTRRR
jgi:heat shock protein HslJ